MSHENVRGFEPPSSHGLGAMLLCLLGLTLCLPAVGRCAPVPVPVPVPDYFLYSGNLDEAHPDLHLTVPTAHGRLQMRWMPTSKGEDIYDGYFSIFHRGRWLVDGARPWANFAESLAVEGIFDFPGYSVVVFEGTVGGNSNLPSYVAVVVTRRGAVAVHAPAFHYVPGDFAMVRRADGVVLDFGFLHGVRRAFLVNRRGLMPLPRYRPGDASRLPADQCESVRSIVANRCSEMSNNRFTPTQTCAAVNQDVLLDRIYELGTGWSTWRTMRWIRQHPAFEPREFTRRCRLACRSGQPAQALDGFELAVCHRRPGNTSSP